MIKERVVVAMSGGVDSSVAAYLLLKQGFDVIGLTMTIGNKDSDNKNITDAKDICKTLDIPLHILDCSKEFDEIIVANFCKEYKKGRTPNPCIICNKYIKFGILLDKARELEARYIATGHYSRVEYSDGLKRFLLKKGSHTKKDQSYFLFALNQDQLSKIKFPIGEYTKEKIRVIAKEADLPVHEREESQEICFVADNDYRKFLEDKGIKKEAGGPIKLDGKTVWKHSGISDYTIGQRKGIGAHKKRVYVTEIIKAENTVVIGEDKDLYKDYCIASNVNYIAIDKLKKPMIVDARIRYRHNGARATISPFNENKAKVEFNKPQRAVTPGQAVVFFDGDIVLGGGWID